MGIDDSSSDRHSVKVKDGRRGIDDDREVGKGSTKFSRASTRMKRRCEDGLMPDEEDLL